MFTAAVAELEQEKIYATYRHRHYHHQEYLELCQVLENANNSSVIYGQKSIVLLRQLQF
jgi:hypothetical protein